MLPVQPDFPVFDVKGMKAIHDFIDAEFLKGAKESCGKNIY